MIPLHQIRRAIISGLLIFIITAIMLEFAVFVFDPIGLKARLAMSNWTSSYTVPHPTGYHFQTGTYTVAGNTVTIDDYGHRITPNNDADCTVAMIGDSVTFGYGISDEQTFSYLLAERLPSVRIINLAYPGYNQSNISDTVDYYPADIYIYTIVHNDNEPRVDAGNNPPKSSGYRYTSIVGAYLLYWWQVSQPISISDDYTPFRELMTFLANHNVLYFSFEPGILHDIASEYNNVVLLPETERVSHADGHPSANGHRVIADTMYPYIVDAISESC